MLFQGLYLGGWLLWHKVWIEGAVAIVAGLAVYPVFSNPEVYILGIPYGQRFGLPDIFNIGICLIVGFFGNEWREKSLGMRGFKRVSIERAETVDGAKAKYLLRDENSGDQEVSHFLE